MLCAYETAMRLSEIIKLTPGQIHLDIQHISGAIVDYIDLGIFDTKTGARRTVPVSPRLKEVLQRRMQGLDTEDYIFTTSRGYKIHSNNIPRSMRVVCEKAGIAYGDNVFNKKGERVGIVFHCFRHTRTTKWVEMGFSDEIIRRATGHKSLEAYQQYVKLDPAAVMRLVEAKHQHKDSTVSVAVV
jgi:integrase